MPGFASIKRKVRTINVGAGVNTTYDVDLPRDFAYLGLLLYMSGVITAAAGGGHGGAPLDLNPMSLIRRIQIEGTGGDRSTMIKNYRGFDPVILDHCSLGVEAPRLVVAADDVAAHPFFCQIPVRFGLSGATIPPEIAKSTIINPGQYGKLNLSIQLGGSTDLIAGGDRVETFSAIQIDIIAVQPVNIDLGKSAPLTLRETTLFREASAGSSVETRFTVPLPVGNRYRGILIKTLNEATVAGQSTPIDDTLGPVRFFVGTSQIQRWESGIQICAENSQQNMMEASFNHGGITASSTGVNKRVGCHYFDFMHGGRFESLLDTRKMPSSGVGLDIIFDTIQGAATPRVLEVTAQEILG